jgi:hypothetical protein
MNISEIEFKPQTFKVEDRKISIYLNTENCKVCEERNEEIEPGIYTIETLGHQVYLCKAHAQEFLDGIEDLEGKGDIVRGFIDEADEG